MGRSRGWTRGKIEKKIKEQCDGEEKHRARKRFHI